MQGLLFLYDFRSIASSRSQIDGHLIVSLPEERKIQVEGPRVPVRHGTDIPCATAAIFMFMAITVINCGIMLQTHEFTN